MKNANKKWGLAWNEEYKTSNYEAAFDKIEEYTGAAYREIKKDPKQQEIMNEFIDQLQSLHYSAGTVYRGDTYTKARIKQFAPGKIVSLDSVSSWSSSLGESMMFATRKDRRNGVLLVEEFDKVKNGISIKALSRHPEEDEILYSGKTKFEVIKVEENKFMEAKNHIDMDIYGTVTVIYLKEAEE
jgi:hypothetical protein